MSNSDINYTIVYVLTNPAMPNMVKIGKTDRESIEIRMRELFTSGVPVPFDCYYACRTDSNLDVEKKLHIAFDPYRVNPQREFFEIDPEQAKVILEMISVEDMTPDINKELDETSNEVDKASSDRLKKKRRPSLNFFDMGIPVNSILLFEDGQHTVKVISERKVEYDGSEITLTRVTSDLLGKDYDVHPTPHWTFEGKNLNDIYQETYADF